LVRQWLHHRLWLGLVGAGVAQRKNGYGERSKPMVTHKNKILPEYLKAVTEGRKPFEIRNNDRNYQEGDTVVLQEWTGSQYTGYQITKQVGFVTDFEQKPGYVVFGLV
jgi:hypothetical protein